MDKACSLLVAHSAGETPNVSELKAALEQSASIATKIEALKKCIAFTLSGEALPGVLMHVIRFVLPQKDHTLKKLLLLYLEAIDKVDDKGKLKPEMILMWYAPCTTSTKNDEKKKKKIIFFLQLTSCRAHSNALRIDLNHQYEYIRGSTCRFLCHMREAELLEPLVPSVVSRRCRRHLASFVGYCSYRTVVRRLSARTSSTATRTCAATPCCASTRSSSTPST